MPTPLNIMWKSSQLHYLAGQAYLQLIKNHTDAGLEQLIGYMSDAGFDNEMLNNQITFWSRASRSPVRDRIVFEMQGPQDEMLTRNHSSVRRTQWYVGYYLNETNVREIQQEMDDAPDRVEEARAILKDRANAQDPMLRHRPISVDIPQ